MMIRALNVGRHRIGRLLLIVLAILAVSLAIGCSSLSTLHTAPSPTPTWTATPAPSSTPLPTATATPTRTPTPSPTPVPLHVAVAVEPASLVQGHTGTVRVSSNLPISLTASFGDQELLWDAEGELSYVALVGISALAEPGPVALHLAARAEGGQELSFETQVQVVAGDFESEELYFDETTAQLLDPAISQPEAAHLKEVYAAVSPERLWQGAWSWPAGERITSAFGTRRLYEGELSSYHSGTDLGGATGTPVTAPAAGRVVLAEQLQVRGNAVILDHGWGVLSGYYHLDRIDVQVGQMVQAGDLLGEMGSTGLVTGSHLHWELQVGGVPVDATEWVEKVFP